MVSAETEPRSMRDGILWEQKSIGFLLQPTEQKRIRRPAHDGLNNYESNRFRLRSER
jgi:hypothetical protein